MMPTVTAICLIQHQGHTCRREKDHPGYHMDPTTQVVWQDRDMMPAMPVQPSANVTANRVACGAAYPSNAGWVICTLPGGHTGNHDSDPNIPPAVMLPSALAEPVADASTSMWAGQPPPGAGASGGVVSGDPGVGGGGGHAFPPIIEGGANRAPVGADYSQMSHIALRLMAETQAEGNARYGVGNWQKGLPMSNLLSHAFEHLVKLMNGDTSDGTTVRQHLGHALWNLEKAAHFYYTRPDLIDITPLRGDASRP